MPDFLFHPDVASEVKASYQWYQTQAEGLGDDFLHELELACQTIVEFPATWPRLRKSYRRFLLSRFPFSVVYRVENSTIFVVAVMHNSRRPGYWQTRE